MKSLIKSALIGTLSALLFLTVSARCQSLKIATLNLWTGLDYHGIVSMGEYESSEQRERRFQMMLKSLYTEHPDIIALQEANPAHRIASELERSLGYDVVWQRGNSGLKFGPWGIPSNLNEGLLILARKGLNLEFVDVWNLAKPAGVFGNTFSFHVREVNMALVAKACYQDKPVFIVSVHTMDAVPADSPSSSVLAGILDREGVEINDRSEYFSELRDREASLRNQLEHLAGHLQELPPAVPQIVVGDFNLATTSPIMQQFLDKTQLVDIAAFGDAVRAITWDPEKNTNIRYSRDSLDASKDRRDPLGLLSAWYDGQPRRIDYVLVDSIFAPRVQSGAKVFLDSSEHGLYASDHYGLLADVPLARFLAMPVESSDSVRAVEGSELEPFPIISYDTDVGFGYGAKAFYLNPLGTNESFDLVLFNSSKGERWYRFVYSIPDFEVRQGKIYPIAFDFIADYDKYLRNSFFGVGNSARYENKETYTREPLELSLVFSRGFSTRVVGQVGLKFELVTNFSLSDTSRLLSLSPGLNKATARYHSLFATYRYDSRNSFVNPSRGIVLQGEVEYAPRSFLTNVSLGRAAAWLQYYSVLFYPKTVLALRLGLQGLIGDNLPIQVLLPIGGNQTVRGSPQDRYLDMNSAIMNAEIRFPLYWRFGGVLGYDAGKVWHRPLDATATRWATNPVVGLRFYMDTFVVRADLGFGRETTGFYLNFGQLF